MSHSFFKSDGWHIRCNIQNLYHAPTTEQAYMWGKSLHRTHLSHTKPPPWGAWHNHCNIQNLYQTHNYTYAKTDLAYSLQYARPCHLHRPTRATAPNQSHRTTTRRGGAGRNAIMQCTACSLGVCRDRAIASRPLKLHEASMRRRSGGSHRLGAVDGIGGGQANQPSLTP